VSSIEDINREKAAKPRMDLVPPDHSLLAAQALGAGFLKHGPGPSGMGTYEVPGTEQSTVWSHWASKKRHEAAMERGEVYDDGPGGSGMTHLACKCAQDTIIAALILRPPGLVHPHDRRWYLGREDVQIAESIEEWQAQRPGVAPEDEVRYEAVPHGRQPQVGGRYSGDHGVYDVEELFPDKGKAHIVYSDGEAVVCDVKELNGDELLRPARYIGLTRSENR
jgi:hypothetical protein